MGIALAVAPAPVPRASVLRLLPRQPRPDVRHEARPAAVPAPVVQHLRVDHVGVSGLVAALREDLSATG